MEKKRKHGCSSVDLSHHIRVGRGGPRRAFGRGMDEGGAERRRISMCKTLAQFSETQETGCWEPIVPCVTQRSGLEKRLPHLVRRVRIFPGAVTTAHSMTAHERMNTNIHILLGMRKVSQSDAFLSFCSQIYRHIRYQKKRPRT